MTTRLSDEERRLRAITEAEWLRTVVEYAQHRGWRVAHFKPAQTPRGQWLTAVAADGAGFPDLVLARDGRVVFAELKRMTGRLSEEQQAWFEALGRYRSDRSWNETYLWRPCDWPAVEELLA